MNLDKREINKNMQADFVVCELCGKKFKQITSTHLKKAHDITFLDYKVLFPNSETLTGEAREKIATNAAKLNSQGKIGFCKGHKVNEGKEPWNKNTVGLQTAWSKGKNKETCTSLRSASEKISVKRKQMFKSGELKKQYGKDNPMFGKKLSEQHKQALWAGWKNSYTKPELKLMDIIRGAEGWEYVGNGTFHLRTKKQCRIPDFINREKKRIIEVYGDYWHKGENPNDKIMEYKEIGWDCIVIWESEIMSDDFNIEKINYFL